MNISEVMDAQRREWSEAEFQSVLMGEMNELGWLCYHTHDSRRSRAGFPDVVALRNGYMIVAELKRQDAPKKIPPAQVKWGKAFRELSYWSIPEDEIERRVRYFLWRPSDWDEIMRAIR